MAGKFDMGFDAYNVDRDAAIEYAAWLLFRISRVRADVARFVPVWPPVKAFVCGSYGDVIE